MYKVHIINKYIKNRNPTRHFGSPYPSKVNLPSEYQQFTKKRRVLWRSITGRRQNVALIAKLLNFTGGGGEPGCSKVLVLLAQVYLRCLQL